MGRVNIVRAMTDEDAIHADHISAGRLIELLDRAVHQALEARPGAVIPPEREEPGEDAQLLGAQLLDGEEDARQIRGSRRPEVDRARDPAAVLLGEGDREVVVGSVRTSKLTLDVDQFLKMALGSDYRGRYYGGGRYRAGGFEIPIGFLEGTTEEEQMRIKWDAFNRQIQSRLLDTVGLGETAAE